MSYARRSPRPGEIYDRYGPPRPSKGNAYSYARSEVDGARPSRPPPHQYPMAGPSYRGGNYRPVQRAYDDAGFDLPPRQSPRGPPYNHSYSKSSDRADFDYPRNPSRPRAMTEDRSRNFGQPPPSSVRPFDDARDYQSRLPPDRGLPPRVERRRGSDAYYLDSEETGQALENNQNSEAAQGSWSWDKIKQTVWGARDQNQSLEEDRVPDDTPPETQNTLWTKLTTVGATFQKKIHGDDGYASDASDYQGETHLIRIMKKYYTEKAESPHDLPDWLFTQAELKEAHSRTTGPSLVNPPRPERRPGRYDDYDEDNDYRRGDPAGGGHGRLTDIYDSVDQDRGYHSRNGSSAKQSFDSGYGSSSNTPRRRGRYDDSRSEFSEPTNRPSLGRNRLAINNDQSARFPGSNFNSSPRRPMNNASPYNDGRGVRGPSNPYSNESRFRIPPVRGAPGPPPSAYSAPTVVDYFRPSGQDDRYPMPKSTNKRSYA